MKKLLEIGDVFTIDGKKPRYLVINVAFDGGGTGHGPHDIYPDGHHVYAKRLKDDGTYDPKAETKSFWQSGSFCTMIMPDRVKLVGKMKQTFVSE